MLDTVTAEENPQFITQPGGVLVHFSVEVRNTVEEIDVFTLLS